MALTIGDNFSYQGAKPLDARLKYATIAAMIAVAESTLYDGCLAYVTAIKKYYTYDSSNTVDEDTGKWREFEGGGDIPTKTSDLINDSGFITNLVNNLANYYMKSEVYTQAEVDALISAIVTLDIRAVATLPTEDISRTTIYLVPSASAGTSNIKDEYINLDGTSAGWELIGSTDIDLTGYVTDADLTTALADYVTSAGLTTILADYVTSTDMETALEDKADVEDIPSAMTASDLEEVKDAFVPNTGAPLRMMNYSTDEQVVGTWLDGKPLYQRTYVGTTPSTADTVGIIATLDLGVVVRTITGMVASAVPVNYDGGTNYYSRCFIHETNKIAMQVKGYVNHPVTITLQYTKTTD